MKNLHGILAVLFYILMFFWLVMVCFEVKADQAAKQMDMLYAIWSLLMFKHHFEQWRQP